jgi:hypothetical protein
MRIQASPRGPYEDPGPGLQRGTARRGERRDAIAVEPTYVPPVREVVAHNSQNTLTFASCHALDWLGFGKLSLLNRGDDDGKRQ